MSLRFQKLNNSNDSHSMLKKDPFARPAGSKGVSKHFSLCVKRLWKSTPTCFHDKDFNKRLKTYSVNGVHLWLPACSPWVCLRARTSHRQDCNP